MNALNGAAVGFTYSLIYSGLSAEKSVKGFAKLFIAAAVVYGCFALLDIERFVILPIALIPLALDKRKRWACLLGLFASLSAMMIYVFFVLIIGSLFFGVSPGVMQSEGYDVFMSAASVVFGGLAYKVLAKMDILKHFTGSKSVVTKCVAAEIAILSFVSLIMPLALLLDNQNFIFFSHYLLAAVSMIFAAYVAYHLAAAEAKIRYDAHRQKYEAINKRIINAKYADIISLKHYYNKLYQILGIYIQKQDWPGLSGYYKRYISPVHEDYIENDITTPQLELLNAPLVKNLILDTLIKAKHIYKARVFLNIAGFVDEFGVSEMDLFIILNEWINNALHAVEGKDGFVQILISPTSESISIRISNPIFEAVNMHELYKPGYSTKQGHDGVGLTQVRKIVSSYEHIEHMTYFELGRFVQCLIIRR